MIIIPPRVVELTSLGPISVAAPQEVGWLPITEDGTPYEYAGVSLGFRLGVSRSFDRSLIPLIELSDAAGTMEWREDAYGRVFAMALLSVDAMQPIKSSRPHPFDFFVGGICVFSWDLTFKGGAVR